MPLLYLRKNRNNNLRAESRKQWKKINSLSDKKNKLKTIKIKIEARSRKETVRSLRGIENSIKKLEHLIH